MRLTPEQAAITRAVVEQTVAPDARVWLFGSRADDLKRGGDIDLLVETDRALPNRVQTLCLLYARLVRVLGDRKIDVLLRDARTQPAPIFEIARQTGVLL